MGNFVIICYVKSFVICFDVPRRIFIQKKMNDYAGVSDWVLGSYKSNVVIWQILTFVEQKCKIWFGLYGVNQMYM